MTLWPCVFPPWVWWTSHRTHLSEAAQMGKTAYYHSKPAQNHQQITQARTSNCFHDYLGNLSTRYAWQNRIQYTSRIFGDYWHDLIFLRYKNNHIQSVNRCLFECPGTTSWVLVLAHFWGKKVLKRKIQGRKGTQSTSLTYTDMYSLTLYRNNKTETRGQWGNVVHQSDSRRVTK